MEWEDTAPKLHGLDAFDSMTLNSSKPECKLNNVAAFKYKYLDLQNPGVRNPSEVDEIRSALGRTGSIGGGTLC
jgi:hypothetical protein